MTTQTPNRTLLVIGAGPLVGRAITTLFASKRYNNVALLARRSEELAKEKSAVENAAPRANVKTYVVDVTDYAALNKALNEADRDLGKPEVVLFNAARVKSSDLESHPVEDVEYEFKVGVQPNFHRTH
jgi:NAD(P)-dependent dehydrogenase (short-subunit alcohol dehydrogenase family)